MSLEHERSTDIDDVPSGGLTVTLWTRRPVCGARTTVIGRLSDLRAGGTLSDFGVETWPDEVVIDGDGDGVVTAVEQLESWAGERGLGLRPPFETRTVSPLIGQSREVLTLPMMVLVARDDDGLAGVYPCTDGDRTVTVSDALDAVETAGEFPHQSS